MSLRSSSHLLSRINRGFHATSLWKTECTDKGDQTNKQKQQSVLPEEPTHCCMSGCANCVWIKYAQELAQSFEDGDAIAKQKIMEKVQDPQLRAYLFTQLGLNETNPKN